MAMIARTPQARIYSSGGTLLNLGARVGGGGEGNVFALRDVIDRVVKIYHNPPIPVKASKISAMTHLANDKLTKLTAWPIETVHSAPNGPLIGFTMPNVKGHKPVIELYSPKRRLHEFPDAGWPFLIHCAANTARAFLVTHESGTVIGDVNHSNLFIARDGTVKLIDCDSFQVRTATQQWLCEVGVPEFQPPELQGVNFSTTIRQPNHDNFGLAVLIFLLLFVGRHPFIGRFLGSGDMPVERAIREFRFAYGANAANVMMSPPPGSLRMDCITPALAQLFERAFSRQGAQSGGRPRAAEWVPALEELASKLKKCASNGAHHYFGALAKCPWCEIEALAGFALFPIKFVGAPGASTFNIATLWQRIQSVPKPGTVPSLTNPSSVRVPPSSGALRLCRSRRRRAVLAAFLPMLYFMTTSGLAGAANAIALAATGIGMGFLLVGGQKTALQDCRKRTTSAKQRWSAIEQQWKSESSSAGFDNEMAQLERAKAAYEALPGERLRKLHELETNRYATQKNAFLDRCYISNAKIKGIGEGRKQILLAHNIETAADVDRHRIFAITGFGGGLVGKLIEWRQQQEAKFKFDPSQGVPQADKARVEQTILMEKTRLEMLLAQGATQLGAVSQRILTRRNLIKAEAESATKELAQATVDLRHMEGRGAVFTSLVVSLFLFLAATQVVQQQNAFTVWRDRMMSTMVTQPIAPQSTATKTQQPSALGTGVQRPEVATATEQSTAKATQSATSSPSSVVPTRQSPDANTALSGQGTVAANEQKGPEKISRSIGSPTASTKLETQVAFPQRLSKIIESADWPAVLSAIDTANKLDPGAVANWSSQATGHEGIVMRTGMYPGGGQCVQYRVVRKIAELNLLDFVEMCNGRAQ